MKTAIRWSTHSTIAEQRFLLVDVAGSTLRLCKATSEEDDELKYDVLYTQNKVPAFRAFDWSPADEGLVAVGQPDGETSVLRIAGHTQDAFSLPVKMPRLCNAVTFNTQGLLAAGLDKVRNDFCLNVWDITQRVSAGKSPGSVPEGRTFEPLRKYAINETITSIKFFVDQPETLVTGVKGQFIRIYDLRDSPGNPAIQYPTRCVQNLAIDSRDENYFASAMAGKDSVVSVWDRRSGPRFTAATIPSGHSPAEQAILQLRSVVNSNAANLANVWSVRFSKTKRGCLGILSSTGQLKVYELNKEYGSLTDLQDQQSSLRTDSNQTPEKVYTDITHNVQYPYYDRQNGCEGSKRVVSFDFVALGESFKRHAIIGLRGKDAVSVFEITGRPSTCGFASTGHAVIGEGHQSSSLSKTVKASTVPQEETQRIASEVNFKEVKPIAKGEISENLRSIRAKIEAAKTKYDRNRNKLKLTAKDPETGRTKRNLRSLHLSSQQAHEMSFSLGPPGFKLNIREALTLLTIERRRCEEGYLFQCKKNIDILNDDRWLQELWLWIGRAMTCAADGGMICESLDLSYLGVQSLWRYDLGSNPETRTIQHSADSQPQFLEAVKGLVRELELSAFEAQGLKTDFPELRQLCLFNCGLAISSADLELVAKDLVRQGQRTKAAALALFHGNAGFACSALLSGRSSPAHKLLAMGIRGFAKGDYDDDWNQTCKNIAEDLDDPYSRAMMAFVGSGDWYSVLDETALPLSNRVGVALMHLPDDALTAYLNQTSADAIREGDIEGIVLTGLTEQAMDLFQNYVIKYNDVQSAALAMALTSPRYFIDDRLEQWKESYRYSIQSWKMHHARIRFDIQTTRLSKTSDGRITIKPPPRQVTLRCNYCERPLARSDNGRDDSTIGEGAHITDGHPLGGYGATSGTACPSCGRHLPRCGVCMRWLGMPDPTSRGGIAASATQDQDPMAGFLNFCMTCKHGCHADHARDWFSLHQVCPVPECQCFCGVGA